VLYVLFGEDDFSLSDALRQIKKSIGDQSAIEANTSVLEGRQLSPDQLAGVCGAVPFLAEKRLVIINGLLQRFETKAKATRKKTTAKNGKQDGFKTFAEYFGSIPETTVLVLVDGKIKPANPLLRELTGRATVKAFPLPNYQKLRQWTKARVEAGGGTISQEAVELLARFVGSNLWIMSNEIDKLLAYADGQRIKEADVKNLVSYVQEGNVFAMVDAILEHRAGAAEQLLQQLLQQGEAPTQLLYMISRQVQRIVRAKELTMQGKSSSEIQRTLGLQFDFIVQRTMEQVKKNTQERLRFAYHRILEADISIKTGRYEPELTLNMLIAELCQ